MDGVLNAVCFKLPGKMSIQSGVGLGAWEIYWIREAIQEVFCRNCPPCMRNLLFPKVVPASLGTVGISEPVPTYLQYFNSR